MNTTAYKRTNATNIQSVCVTAESRGCHMSSKLFIELD